MRFEANDQVANIEPINDIKILTPLTIRFAGDMQFYPDSPITGKGYHMTYYDWNDDIGLIYCDLFIAEEEVDNKFVIYRDLTQSQIIAIEREDKINEIFED